MNDSTTRLTPQQQRALDHAREVLAEEKSAGGMMSADWRRELRMALRDVVRAFAEDGQS